MPKRYAEEVIEAVIKDPRPFREIAAVYKITPQTVLNWKAGKLPKHYCEKEQVPGKLPDANNSKSVSSNKASSQRQLAARFTRIAQAVARSPKAAIRDYKIIHLPTRKEVYPAYAKRAQKK